MTEDVVEAWVAAGTVFTASQIEELRRTIGYNEPDPTECKINFKIDGENFEQVIDKMFSPGPIIH